MAIFRRRSRDEGPRVLRPERVIVLSFLTAILLGSILLSLPFSMKDGEPPLRYVDALFTATSATCVTGLVVKDTGADFSRFGQLVILFLIQIGGLGIMTMSTFFLMIVGRKMSMRDSALVHQSLGRREFASTGVLIRHAILLTLTFEFVGAMFLFVRFSRLNAWRPFKALYHAVFHSVSAFCNAGFSLNSDSMAQYRSDWTVMIVLMGLIIAGGLGFFVLYNINSVKFLSKDRVERGRLSLHSKVVLTATALLIMGGALLFLLFESYASFDGMPFGARVLNSFFCAATPRTAGLTTVNYGTLSKPSQVLTMFLMFIGASPGSCGGGIKTVTFMVLVATSFAIIRGKSSVTMFKRRLPQRIVNEGIGVVSISIILLLILTLMLSISEHQSEFAQNGDFVTRIFFEEISAFATVGLSTGITKHLTTLGRLIVTFTMFIGRVSPLILAVMIARREVEAPVKYPEENLMIG